MVTLYGLANCDTTRKARRWLVAREQPYRFVDVREDGIDAKTLEHWVKTAGWERLLNRRSTTWRSLSEGQRNGVDAHKAAALMLAQPTLIKRPVLTYQATVLVGFDADAYAALLD